MLFVLPPTNQTSLQQIRYCRLRKFLQKVEALIIHTNGTENFGRSGESGKKVIPRKVLPFLQKYSTGMNGAI